MGPRGRFVAALLACALVYATGLAPRATDERVPFGVALSLGLVDREDQADKVARYERRRAEAVRELLRIRGQAVHDRNEQAFLSVLDTTDEDFLVRQRRLFAGVQKLRFEKWEYELDTTRQFEPRNVDWQRHGGADVYLPFVTLVYQLSDFDPASVRRESVLTFVERGGRWRLGADTDAEPDSTERRIGATAAHDPWDVGDIEVARSTYSLVIGDPRDRDLLRGVTGLVDQAVTDVTAVWGGGWTRRAVVALPRDDTLLLVIFDHGENFGDVAGVAVPTGNAEAESSFTRISSTKTRPCSVTYCVTKSPI